MRGSTDYGQNVSRDGYAWADVPNCQPEDNLVLFDPRRLEDGFRDDAAYNRLLKSDPVVFLKGSDKVGVICERFANLYADEPKQMQGSVLSFAKRYGFLGVGHRSTFIIRSGITAYAEELGTWQREAREMRLAWERFELILRIRQGKRDEYETPDEERALQKLYLEDERKIRQGFANRLDLLKLCDANDFVKAELAYVGLLTDKKLKALTSLQLAWPEGGNGLTMQSRATTLLGAIWLQFAEYVTEVKRLNFCRICGEPIPIVGRSARADNDLCKEGGCRTKASRQGKRVRKSYTKN